MLNNHLIDFEFFKRVSLGDPNFAREIVEKFILDSKHYFAEIEVAISQQDFLRIKRVALQCKSSGQVFGVKPFLALIKKIEIADYKMFNESKDLVLSFKSMFEQFVEEAKALSL
jgi:HPt (histidine-containing phosphotransfer) domain-containing protein